MAGALAAGLVSLGARADAATIVFNTTSGNASMTGNSTQRQLTVSGITVTMTAWGYGTDFNDATLGLYSHGLGACESGSSCTDPWHQVDNKYVEWVAFQFSTPVTPTLTSLYSTDGSDTDLKYFWGTGTLGDLTPGGDGTGAADITYATLPGLGGSNTDNGLAAIRTATLTTGVPVSWLLLGTDPAGVGSHPCGTYGQNTCYDYDKFKIAGVTVNTPERDVPVPEPASLLLLGTGLVGFANRMRRRKNEQ
jgi:PEP-CTERM putative exosortase interaction domain